MITGPIVEKARLHVRRWFAERMPAWMVFHDLEHTLAVTRTAVAMGQAMGMRPADLALLEVAALFHDTGYAVDPNDHEAASAELAAGFLEQQGVAARTVRRVRGLIMATRITATPRTVLQQVLRDADSAKAGQADFGERSERLRREREHLTGQTLDPRAWLAQDLDYLGAHRFHTAYARQRFGRQKRMNMAHVRRQLRQGMGSDGREGVKERYMDRDLSWLSFNERVLQEAKDKRVPLLERIKFLAIYSSNLDEFYRVRVAALRSLAKLPRKDRAALDIPTDRLIAKLNKKAVAQQEEFGRVYREELLPALAAKKVRIMQAGQLGPAQRRAVNDLFDQRIVPLLQTAAVRPGNAPFIEDRKLYFVCRLEAKGAGKEKLVLVNIPSDEVGRFITLPAARGRTDLMFIDDAMRIGLGRLFTGHKLKSLHAIKLSRDAELYLDEEFVGTVKDKVRKSLRKRRTGPPARFLYDSAMPARMVTALRKLLGLHKSDMVPGGRHHHLSDLMKLPVPGHPALRDPDWPALAHPRLGPGKDTFAALAKGDLLLHFPYHDFGQVVQWLRQAATDAAVEHIAIALYRVADNSAVCGALLDALENGKRVTAFVEVQARFDERSNLYWGETLERAGATVIYSHEGLKVHCKLCLVERREKGRLRRYAYLGTGNFNERTATIYSDTALFTARPAIAREVAEVFAHLQDRRHRPALRHLLMAPLNLRGELDALIDREIEAARRGRPAGIIIKVNSLEDCPMVRKLYDASQAGVPVRIIVRGICCLVPGRPRTSERIEAISIVDRYLEHCRTYVFHNQGAPLVYMGSADLMQRNLDRRVEVLFPLLDATLRREVIELLELQWSDRVKARWIDAGQTNPYVAARRGERLVRAQEATYRMLEARSKTKRRTKAGAA
ncbi:MAG: polyphosphate kinase 1 [Flavobacteriales bacterium]|jgi:polyphosphate kinase|nr:polyphosphate kinase 1 [Flavobacteriales bacterium]